MLGSFLAPIRLSAWELALSEEGRPSEPTDDLRITSGFSCVARGLKPGASFRFAISEGGPGCGAAPREKADGFYIPDHDGSDPLTSCDLPRWHPVLLRGEDHPAYVPQPAQFHDHRDGSSGAPGPPAHSIARARWCRSLVPR